MHQITDGQAHYALYPQLCQAITTVQLILLLAVAILSIYCKRCCGEALCDDVVNKRFFFFLFCVHASTRHFQPCIQGVYVLVGCAAPQSWTHDRRIILYICDKLKIFKLETFNSNSFFILILHLIFSIIILYWSLNPFEIHRDHSTCQIHSIFHKNF